ncbi:MAG: PAS domain-containing protein [Bdellovibrionales bacterium]|nr:PAS domain-containing protein [Massilia sp.]
METAAPAIGSAPGRDHARRTLSAIAHKLRAPQTPSAPSERFTTLAPPTDAELASLQVPAAAWLQAGYSINQLVSQYRAMRSGVLALWSRSVDSLAEASLADVIRFNEAIDQALAESVARYDCTVGHSAVAAQLDMNPPAHAEAALRLSEEKFRTIANAMPQMIWSTLPDGYHDYYNDQWYQYTGVPVGSTDGEGWNGMFHPDDQPVAWARWRQCLASGDIYEIEYRLRHRSGQYRWVLGRALPVRSATGEIVRWMGTCTDIHMQKLAEAELTESSERKDEFLAMLAHELRNPLAPISSAAQLLMLAKGNEKAVMQASEIIARQVRHMSHLVDDLLDVSRVTRGLAELDKEDLDLKAVLIGAVEQARPLIEARRHQLRLRISTAHAWVNGDKTRLTQIFTNLLNNAAKYTPPQGEIALVLEVQSEQIQISIHDNGEGISADLLPHVFDIFTQARRTPHRTQGGLGLGLTLVKSLAALHAGSIAVASPGIGLGSTFTVTLPLQQGPGVEPTVAPASPNAPVLGAKALQITIVDDNADAGQTLAMLLEADGHFVGVHEHASDAIAESAVKASQVYILDIGLPDIDGYALARELRANSLSANSVLIALTGYGHDDDRARSREAGFDHHFVKPIDLAQLSHLLATVA